MLKKKKPSEKGKIKLSEYFKKLEKGDRVAIIRELSVPASFEKRMQGKTGTIKGRRGNSYVVDIKDGNKEKTIITKAIHLKKLNSFKKQD